MFLLQELTEYCLSYYTCLFSKKYMFCKKRINGVYIDHSAKRSLNKIIGAEHVYCLVNSGLYVLIRCK